MVDQPKIDSANELAELEAFVSPDTSAPQPVSSTNDVKALEAFVEPELKEEKYGGIGQHAKTLAEGASSAGSFGLSTGVEVASGLATPEDIRNRREVNPITYGVGQAIGLVATALVPGLGEASAAKILTGAGKAGAAKLGLGAAETIIPKIGSAAAKGAIENALFQAGDETSKLFTKDPTQNIDTVMANMGLATVAGGVIGGGIGSIAPIWQATFGKKVSGALNSVAERFGGIEGQSFAPIDDLANRAGIELSPVSRAALSDDPLLQDTARTLLRSEGSASALKGQADIGLLRRGADESVLGALGKTSDDLAKMPELSKAAEGKRVGSSIVSKLEARYEPIEREFTALEAAHDATKLERTIAEKTEEFAKTQKKAVSDLGYLTKEVQDAVASGSHDKAIKAQAALREAQMELQNIRQAAKAPGTIDSLSEGMMKLAQNEGWIQSPSSKIMREVRRVMNELPLQKTIKHLNQFEQRIGDNTWNLLDPTLSAAGMKMKALVREARADALSKEIGRRGGDVAVERFNDVRHQFSELAGIRDELNTRLKVKARGLGGYIKALKEAVETDSENVMNRLSGEQDAHLLTFLAKEFPEGAQALREYHVNKLLEAGRKAAGPDSNLNAVAVGKAIKKMSPEMKAFVLSEESANKIGAVGELLEKLEASKFKVNAGARQAGDTVERMTDIAGVAGAVLSGHPGLAIGGLLAKQIFKDTPDALRYAFLKFMGSNKPIDAGAFKVAVDTIQAVIKGESALNKASKSLFQATEKSAVSMVNVERNRDKLDKLVVMSQTDPEAFMNLGSDVAHYMPEHGSAIAQSTISSLNYLASQRPNTTPASPLDSQLPPDPGKQAIYNNLLDLANAPLSITKKIKHGTIVPREVEALRAMTPGLHGIMSAKFLNDMTKHMAKGGVVPYKTRIGLSLFLGQPLDSTLKPASILAAQPKPQQQPQGPQGGQKPPSASSTKGISKLPSSYQTPDQAREQHAQKR